MPIHGHTKIELTSQTTGEVETIEKDNIVTNAVSQIFNAFNGMALLREANANGEYGSTSDKSWELLESLYGGILLYDTALGSDPDTLFAPPEANLVGSGVPKVLNNGKGLQRGSFNTTESKTDLENGVVTFVYDFATSQANGTIASVCLTSRYGGFFGESETALPAADGSNTSSYYNSALFGQETIFPNAPGQNDRHLYGRPLYADPENDEMVFGAISNNKLVLRYATALTTEIDLFNPINTTRVKKTEERDLSDFLQVDHFSYCAVSYDVDADKICVVSTPGADQLKTTGLIRVRTYDRKTLEEKTYAFTNPTGVTLAGNVGGTSPGLRNTGRLLGGCLFMAGYTTSPAAKAVPFFKIPLANPSNVTAITTHDQLKTTGKIRVRTYDRKTLEAKTYEFANPTGVTLAGNVGGTSPGLRNTGRLLGGCLFMAGYTTSPAAKAVPFFKIPLANPSNVTAITTHDLLMPMFQDMHDGRIYFMGSRYTACGTVLNTATNEMHAIEAYYNYEQYPYLAVPVLGQPAVPYMVRYDANSGNNQSTVHQGIRRNYLATINDLDAPVQKTADKTMKITYTLRREES